MGVTTIRALVNMTNQPAKLQNNHTHEEVVTDKFEAKKCSIRVPHCAGEGNFPGSHLRLQFTDPQSGKLFIYSIWQENISTSDWVRFNEYTPSPNQDLNIDPQYYYNARGLINGRNGSEYVVSDWSDALLVIDERLWVILVQI